MRKGNLAFVLVIVSMCLLVGCSGTLRSTPHMGFDGIGIKGNWDRDDFIVLDKVEGSSNKRSYFFGLVQIIDDENLKLFWIPFYEVIEAYQPFVPGEFRPFCLFNETAKRAYYKALEASPDADAVLYKALTTKKSGFPFIYTKQNSTFVGKAIKLKTDK